MIGLLRSTAFRVALVFALALTLTTSLVFALVAWRFYESDLAHVKSVLSDEVAKAVPEPLDRLRRRLDLRLTEDLRHLDYVGLFAADGSRLFGNVAPGFDVPEDGQPHLQEAPPLRLNERGGANAVFVARRRPDGVLLVLGRSLAMVDELESAMLGAFAAALVPVVLLALALGTVVSRRAFRRLASIQDAVDRVMAGELDVRLPASGTHDDVDELVRAVNLMLDEFGRLIGQIRSVGDDIAHDLRAPLTVMRARLERGLAGSSEAELRTLTAAALEDLERAMTAVTALLRISELESGVRRGAFSPVDLAEVGRDAYELFEPLAAAKGVAMVIDAPRATVVPGDGDLLREAVANLVDNAIKFTPPGGRVTIQCGSDADTLIQVGDTGPGVAAQERDKIVKRFYRARATAGLAPGNGLGLSMAATIVELHGFELRIGENTPGTAPGALFAITRRGDAERHLKAEFNGGSPPSGIGMAWPR